MACRHKQGRPSGKPSAFRLPEPLKLRAKRAARLETKRRGKRVGWTTLMAEGGMAKVNRIIRRAEKQKASAA